MSKLEQFAARSLPSVLSTAMAVTMIGVLSLPPGVAEAATVTPIPISQIPLTVSQPTHPQVLFALGNSQSMDGDLSGAIMTGSGALSTALSSLSSSTSPTNYTVPAGFTPPLNAGTAGVAAYTTNSTGGAPTSGTQYDNSASRLNVAKAGIAAILNQYMPSTDFALMDYQTSGVSLYKTWVYLMSPNGGFSFSNTNTSPPTGTRYINNPCYNYSSSSSTVQSNCGSIASSGLYSPSSQVADQYLLVSASSDDPSVNDVLYDTGSTSVYVDYGGPNKPSPYPPYFSLSQYNSGSVQISYSGVVPSGVTATGPTNAGYVPYSNQVMYAERGFGYYVKGASATSGAILVTNQTAGTAPTAASAAAAIANFTPFLAPETNSTSSSEIKALAVQSPLAGLLAGTLTTLNASKPTTATGCIPPKQYVVLITDGLPTEDLSGNFWPPLGSASAAGYGVNAIFNTDGSLNTTYNAKTNNDQALFDTVAQITALYNAGIQTYVVGLGAGVDSTANPSAAAALAAMAVAGGTASASPQKYFPATSAKDLVTDLQSILTNVSSQNASTSAAAINTATLSANSELYQAIFNPGSSINNAWIGDLDEYPISASGVITTAASCTPTTCWSAQAQLDSLGSTAATSRNIATWDPYYQATSTSPVTPTAVPFIWNSLSATLQGELQPSDTNGSLRVSYLRGSHANEQANSGGTFRNRVHLLGDIVDSAPAYVGPPSGSYSDASYGSFVIAQASRSPMLYFGANDGMLHGVNASTGNEAMGFIPNGVFSNLYKLTDPLYFYHHQFFVDGSPDVNDVLLSTDKKWHTLLVGGENAGGNSIYAMDITNPQNFTSDTAVASSVLWEFTDPDMGLSYSAPQIVRSSASSLKITDTDGTVAGFAVLFGNGYNSASEQPIFYAVNATTGATIAKINLCTATGVPTTACNTSIANGLSSIAAANTSGVLGVPQDMAYAGDLQGNVWGINMSNSNPALWTVELLFQARDGSGNAQPITTTPTLTPNPNFPTELGLMVYVGTGRFIATGDLTSTGVQSFYGIFDNGSDLASYTTAPTMPYTRSNLQAQTLSLATYTPTNTSVVLSTNNPVNLTYASETVTNPAAPPPTITVPPQEGWYFDVSPVGSGARIFTNSLVENGGVQFTINVPPATSATSCGNPLSYLMNVSYGSGGPFAQPSIGLNGGISVGGTVSGKNPVGVYISNAYGSAPTSVPTGTGTNLTILSTANGLIGIPTQGNVTSHVGWWQVQ